MGECQPYFATEDQVVQVISPYRDKLSIAAVNGPQQIVISGHVDSMNEALKDFKKEQISFQQLNVSHAFHSPLMKPALNDFEQVASVINFNPSKIPFVSNLTGKFLDDSEILGQTYWTNQLFEPVQFLKGVQTLFDNEYSIFLEVGPKPSLINLAKRCISKEEHNKNNMVAISPVKFF